MKSTDRYMSTWMYTNKADTRLEQANVVYCDSYRHLVTESWTKSATLRVGTYLRALSLL